MHIKNPIREDYILSDNGLKMRLAAGEISKMEAMSYLCLRQTHHDYEVSTSLEFTPENDNEAAGLVAYQNHDYSYRLLRTTRGIVVIKCEKNVHTTLAECAFSENTATLKITARAQSMNFYVNDALIFEGACGRMLTSDVAGGFVGTTLGIYATAHGADSQRYATFRNILYTGMPADTV
jgi:alpha-N-arabinofuranosidase